MNQQEPGTTQFNCQIRWLTEVEFQKVTTTFSEFGVNVPHPMLAKILGAFVEDELVGFIAVQLLPHTEPLWVKEEYRQNGIGALLATALYTQLDGTGVEVYCTTDEDSVKTIIQSLGFFPVNAYKKNF